MIMIWSETLWQWTIKSEAISEFFFWICYGYDDIVHSVVTSGIVGLKRLFLLLHFDVDDQSGERRKVHASYALS